VVVRAMPVAGPSTPVRYMGTKRSLSPLVREQILSLCPRRHVADLFSGMGSVAASLAPKQPVLVNDALSFTSVFARARFLDYEAAPADSVLRALTGPFAECHAYLRERFGRRLSRERRALEAGAPALQEHIATSPHVGNSRRWRTMGVQASQQLGIERYCLTTLYFSASYFSTRQAIELDALRYAIDSSGFVGPPRDRLLAAWLSSAALLMNTPGHSAQYLKPNNAQMAVRIRRQWERSAWATFSERLSSLGPLGDRAWRRANVVTGLDALDLIATDAMKSVSVAYADPPYTKDHYSRFYHVHETLGLYDFPESRGAGRYRDGRFFTSFSHVSSVRQSFDRLLREVSRSGTALVLSYPSDGVLLRTGADLVEMLSTYFRIDRQIAIAAQHSTLGASKGSQQKPTTENLYVCTP
jgi:adenine-specific DNA-methyltransferase